MKTKMKWLIAFLFVAMLAWGGFPASAHAWYFGLCSNWYCGAEGQKLDTGCDNPQFSLVQVSIDDYAKLLNSVCFPIADLNSVVDGYKCEAHEADCGSKYYGKCLLDQCPLQQVLDDNCQPTQVQAHFCQPNYLQACQMYKSDSNSAIINDPSCQPKPMIFDVQPTARPPEPQCTPTDLSKCTLSDPQEAACNDISCDQNGRCHYTGKASGEYQWVQETSTTRSHHPLPTNFPSCSYTGMPSTATNYAYCTNSGMSSLDYCFPADQPRTGGSGTGTATGGSGTGGTTGGTSGSGGGLLCPAGTSPTSSCINYTMDSSLTNGLPAFPPDCCK